MLTLPIYNAIINDENKGILRISLVDDPAVESFWLAYNEDKEPLYFSVQNEDERKVLGVVMRADFPIYRKDVNRGDYYVIYSKETIKRWLKS